MNVDKLKVTVDELDKNTGRILLPKSAKELESLGGNPQGKRVTRRSPSQASSTVVQQQAAVGKATEEEERFSLYELAAVIGLLALGAIAVLLGVQNKMLGDQLKSQQAEVEILRGAVAENSSRDLKESILRMADETIFLREEMERLNDYFLGVEPVNGIAEEGVLVEDSAAVEATSKEAGE